MTGCFLFEQVHGRLVWRLALSEWNGDKRLQWWPWYRPKGGGDLRPCASRFGGGFVIPLERAPELAATLSAVAPDGPPLP